MAPFDPDISSRRCVFDQSSWNFWRLSWWRIGTSFWLQLHGGKVGAIKVGTQGLSLTFKHTHMVEIYTYYTLVYHGWKYYMCLMYGLNTLKIGLATRFESDKVGGIGCGHARHFRWQWIPQLVPQVWWDHESIPNIPREFPFCHITRLGVVLTRQYIPFLWKNHLQSRKKRSDFACLIAWRSSSG